MTSTPAGTPDDPVAATAAPDASAPGATSSADAAAPATAPVKAPARRRAPRKAADPVADAPAAVADPAVAPAGADAAIDAEAATPAVKRPGLPYREPGRSRRRRLGTPEDGLGIVDPGAPDPEALAMARRIVELAEDKKAADILLLDVRALTAVTDYFIICSGASERQLGAIADGISEGLKETGVLPLGREGGANAHWVLLDFGAAIVHVMAPPEREYYQLEQLWADATILLRVL